MLLHNCTRSDLIIVRTLLLHAVAVVKSETKRQVGCCK